MRQTFNRIDLNLYKLTYKIKYSKLILYKNNKKYYRIKLHGGDLFKNIIVFLIAAIILMVLGIQKEPFIVEWDCQIS